MPVSGPQARMMRPPFGHGALMLTIQGSALTVGLTPTVRIDGYPVPATYGPNFYPLRPGRHRVDVHTQWLRQFGQAGMEADIREGLTVPGFYAVPLHQFTTGSIGHVKQSRKGIWTLIAFLVLFVLIMCGGIVVAYLLS